MVIQRQRMEIHSGLDGELFFDAVPSIGELVIAGKSYDFEWIDAGLRWDRVPPYRFATMECSKLIEHTIECYA